MEIKHGSYTSAHAVQSKQRKVEYDLDEWSTILGSTPYVNTTVVCLGARAGGEVLAFKSKGAFALGIDLNPGDGPSVCAVCLHLYRISCAGGSVRGVSWPGLACAPGALLGT